MAPTKCSVSGTRHAIHAQNTEKWFGNHKHSVFLVICDMTTLLCGMNILHQERLESKYW